MASNRPPYNTFAEVAYELRTANLIAYSDMLYRRGIYNTAGIGERVDAEIMNRLFTVKKEKSDG